MYKKYKIVHIIIFLTVSINSFAQQSFGIKIGVNSNKLIFKEEHFTSEDTKLGLVFGGYFRIKSAKRFIQPELLFSQKGGEYSYSTLKHGLDTIFTNKIDYVDIPVVFGYYIVEGINIHTGPVFGILLNEQNKFKVEGTSDNTDTELTTKGIGLGWQIGAELKIKRISLSLRYELALNKTIDNIHIPETNIYLDPDGRNNAWQFTIAYDLIRSKKPLE